MVENIIRARTWGLVGERCENDGQGADQALDEWRRHRAESAASRVVEKILPGGR